MAKNVVICMDGTGNRGGRTRGTNVWRIFNSVDRDHPDCEQITYYDDGVGSDDFRLLRWAGGAFGIGLSQKIRDAYAFLAANYEDGDHIYMFGFSRGAFAARSLAGMICRFGLLERDAVMTARRGLRELAVQRVLDAYRSERKVPRANDGSEPGPAQMRACRGIGDLPLRSVPVHFVGVWDTVDAVGGTLGGLSALDWVWRKLCGKRWWGFHDLNPHREIRHAYQALALDDERRTFHPKVWNRPNNRLVDARKKRAANAHKCSYGTEQAVEQVWFAGAHANVGGGYPKDSLSLVPLLWMMHRASECGLQLLESSWAEYREAADPHGRLYSSRAGFAAFYRYGRREVLCRPHVPCIHESVFKRIRRGTDRYAPKVIGKEGYVILRDDAPSHRNAGGDADGNS